MRKVGQVGSGFQGNLVSTVTKKTKVQVWLWRVLCTTYICIHIYVYNVSTYCSLCAISASLTLSTFVVCSFSLSFPLSVCWIISSCSLPPAWLYFHFFHAVPVYQGTLCALRFCAGSCSCSGIDFCFSQRVVPAGMQPKSVDGVCAVE